MNIKDVANTPDKHRDTLIAIARAGDGRWPELRRRLLAAGVEEGWLYNLELDAREHHEVAREERLARPEPESMGADPDLLRSELEKKFADYLSLVLEAPQHLDAETLLELLEKHHETFRAQREITTPAESALSGVSSVSKMFGKPPGGFFLSHHTPPARPMLLEHLEQITSDNGKAVFDHQPFLPLGKVGLLISPGGVGKTTILAQLAVSVATGDNWLCSFKVASPGKVFLGLGEEDQGEVHRRLHSAGFLYGLAKPREDADAEALRIQKARMAEDNIHAAPLCGKIVPLLDLEAEGEEGPFMRELLEYLEVHAGKDGWRLIILDPGSRFMGIENENDNAQATRFIQACEQLTKAPGNPTVLVAHHANKGSIGNANTNQSAARGASAFVDGARWVVNLVSLGTPMSFAKEYGLTGTCLMQPVKSNYGPLVREKLLLRSEYGWTGATSHQLSDYLDAVELSKQRKAAAENARKENAQEVLAKEADTSSPPNDKETTSQSNYTPEP